MRVSVVFYARLADLAGRREWSLDVPSGSRVADVWDRSVQAHGDLGSMTGRVSAAVNADFASFTADVADGDEIAFLPPVSGGAGQRRR